MSVLWAITIFNSFLAITAIRGLWNLIKRVESIQKWVEMLISEEAGIDFTFDELGKLIEEERRRRGY